MPFRLRHRFDFPDNLKSHRRILDENRLIGKTS